MSLRPGSVRRTTQTVVRVAKHPAARWIGSIASAVVAGVVVVLLTTGSPSNSTPSTADSASPRTSPTNPLAGITLTASFIPGLYSADADGFAALLQDGTTITPEMKSAPDCERLHTLLAQAGGVDDGGSYVRLLFQNATTFPATITQVRAEVDPIDPASLGTSIECTQGAGPLTPLKGDIELDSAPAVVRAVKVDKNNEFSWKPGGPYFERQVVQVLPGRGAALDIQVNPGTCTCAWHLVANLTVNGKPITIVATDGTSTHALEFRTTAFLTLPPRECWAFDFHPPHLVQASPPC